jgi:hypothetical protein
MWNRIFYLDDMENRQSAVSGLSSVRLVFMLLSTFRRVDGRFGSRLRGNHPAFIPLAPSDPYMGHTAQLFTYSTNICTEYFKRAA